MYTSYNVLNSGVAPRFGRWGDPHLSHIWDHETEHCRF